MVSAVNKNDLIPFTNKSLSVLFIHQKYGLNLIFSRQSRLKIFSSGLLHLKKLVSYGCLKVSVLGNQLKAGETSLVIKFFFVLDILSELISLHHLNETISASS